MNWFDLLKQTGYKGITFPVRAFSEEEIVEIWNESNPDNPRIARRESPNNLNPYTFEGDYLTAWDNNNEYDNKDITSKIASLRVEKANILGFESHAHYVLDNTMAKTPDAVYGLLNQLWAPALKRAKNELNEMQILANEEGNNFEIASWDWWHYAEKVRKDKYDLDEHDWSSVDDASDYLFEHKVVDKK